MVYIYFEKIVILIITIHFVCRIYINVKNRKCDFIKELKYLLLLVCFLIIFRVTFFPWSLQNGKIQPLIFDSMKVLPLRINLIPIVELFNIYDGWLINFIGNIVMFIPICIMIPICFEKVRSFLKIFLIGVLISLFIEILQLPFYDRVSDIDDLIMNSTGAMIGGFIYVIFIKKFKKRNNEP